MVIADQQKQMSKESSFLAVVWWNLWLGMNIQLHCQNTRLMLKIFPIQSYIYGDYTLPT